MSLITEARKLIAEGKISGQYKKKKPLTDAETKANESMSITEEARAMLKKHGKVHQHS